MHLSLLEPPPPLLTSPIHRLGPGVKVSCALALILTTVSVPQRHAGWLCIVAGTLAVIYLTSRVPLKHLFKRLIMLEPFAIGIALLSVFQPGGWKIMLLVLARCTLCFVVTILLSATTPVSELIRVMRSVRMPSLLITTMLLMHRYLFVLLDESQRMRRARASRTFVKTRWLTWRTLSTVIGQLFIRSADRADRVYAAMCARGWR